MENKKIAALTELLTSIESGKFDLEAWKLKASIVLKKIFGESDEKARLIEQLQYNFSSWSLRDHSGGKQHDPVKTKASEIIEAGILELQLQENEDPIIKALNENLSGKKYAKLLELIGNKDNKGIKNLVTNLDNDTKEQLLTQILLSLT